MSMKRLNTRRPGEPPPLNTAPEPPEPKPRNKGGRPKNSREVANRQTVYLDQARYDALAALSKEHERSMHSLLIEAIDKLLGKRRKKLFAEDSGISP